MVTIENDLLKVSIHPKGAELRSVYNKQTKLEHIWNGDPAFWAKSSPVLFPIVGTLKENTYYYEEAPYTLSRHGFARDMEFEVTGQTATSVVFTLVDTAATREKFPFRFRFDMVYRVIGNKLELTYQVHNRTEQNMYFSVGGHPAFSLPLVAGTVYTDYYLEFNKTENAGRWPISKDGLIELFTIPLLDNSNKLSLNKELFYKDAIVFKNLHSSSVKLLSPKTEHGLELDFTGFPYLGIWAAKDADFICIEPWCGIADSTDSNQQLAGKEGINHLAPQSLFERSWSLTAF